MEHMEKVSDLQQKHNCSPEVCQSKEHSDTDIVLLGNCFVDRCCLMIACDSSKGLKRAHENIHPIVENGEGNIMRRFLRFIKVSYRNM